MALDHAKFTAWQLKLPLVLVPSILSVDAAFTRAVGVREDQRVCYVGDISTVLQVMMMNLLDRRSWACLIFSFPRFVP